MRKAARRVTELTATEDTKLLLHKLDELFGQFLDARERLEYEKVELANGEELHRFYKEMTSKLNEIRRKLK
ncbi:hypothetical protein D3C86_2137740 [compost metagenome]